jgi:CRP/FNR family transcriptional regulator, cyclic AMP receptor protein
MQQDLRDPKGWTNVLAEIPLFAGLGARHLRKVADAARLQRFPANTVIMRAGDSGDDMHVVLDGALSVRRPRMPDLTLPTGSFVGELALLDDGPRTATVLADGDVVTLTITRARFRKLLREEPLIAIAIAEELARRLRSIQALH